MKAALCVEPGKPLEIVDIRIDKPAPREVLIRTHTTGLCRSDLTFIDGSFPFPVPFVPGHEAAGVVEAVGSDVVSVRPGDHVVTCLAAFCGTCEQCVTGHVTLCQEPRLKRAPDEPQRLSREAGPVHHFLNLSAFAEQMLVHENACVAIDREMPLDRAALIGCAVTTGAGAVFHDSDLKPGETIAIIGCGGIGLAAVNAARIGGAGRIVAIDPQPDKRVMAEKLGATDVFDPQVEGAADQLVALTGGGAHKVIECAGRPETAELAWAITRRGGTATVLGMIGPGKSVSLPGPSFLQGKRLQGSLMGSSHWTIDIPRLVSFYQRGLLDLDSLIDETMPLAEINRALDKMRKGDTLRSLISYD